MKTQNILIAHPSNDNELQVVKAFFKALKIKFEVTEEQPYNPEFVTKIENSRKEIEEGNFTRVKKEDLKQFLGI